MQMMFLWLWYINLIELYLRYHSFLFAKPFVTQGFSALWLFESVSLWVFGSGFILPRIPTFALWKDTLNQFLRENFHCQRNGFSTRYLQLVRLAEAMCCFLHKQKQRMSGKYLFQCFKQTFGNTWLKDSVFSSKLDAFVNLRLLPQRCTHYHNGCPIYFQNLFRVVMPSIPGIVIPSNTRSGWCFA